MIRPSTAYDLIAGKSPNRRRNEIKARRWESAETNRLNKAHWERVTGQPINADLVDRLETLRNRCEHEAYNNPHFDGMVHTYVADVVGRNGPTLQVRSSRGKGYDSKLERIWKGVWGNIDINGMCSGVDRLKQWVRMSLLAGEFLEQIVNDETAAGPVKFRLQALHPRRLPSSPQLLGQANIVLGIERTKTGKPIKYHILDEMTVGGLPTWTGKTTSVDAKNILHLFEVLEPDQARGVPRLSSVLSAIGDVRDFDDETLEGARQAALYTAMLTTTDIGANPIKQDETETVEIERGLAMTMPPGWSVTQMVPQQPSARYEEFRRERHGEFGLPIGMPGIKVRQDSTKSSFVSARFDSAEYRQCIVNEQGWLERVALNGLVDMTAREASLAGQLPSRPAEVEYSWDGWPVAPVIDEVKHASSDKMNLENQIKSWSATVRANGDNPELVIKQLEQDAKNFEDAGLPPIPAPKQTAPPRAKGVPKLAREELVPTELNGNGRSRLPS